MNVCGIYQNYDRNEGGDMKGEKWFVPKLTKFCETLTETLFALTCVF